MESKKLSARVSAYRDAVVAARGAGVTWAQLAALFDAQPKYFAKVCTRAMSGGRYQPTEQLPLPEPQKQLQQQHPEKQQDEQVAQREPAARRPLPGQIPVGDGDAMNEALAAKGIKWR